ncbi:MAG: DUF3098 domain-containing protein [Chitinophagia bacterium]|jgi:hypothetical protein
MSQKTKNNRSLDFFGKSNYTWMLVGAALIIIGMLLMAGGKSTNPDVFNADEVYSFRRITLAPMLIIAGFIVEIFAIFKKS